MNEPQVGSQASSGAETKQPIVVQVFGRTDVGLVREHNEDNFLVADLTRGNRSIKPEVRSHGVGDKGSLFVVCDGMGGAAAGEVASRIAVDTIYDEMQAGDAAETDEDLARQLDRAICEAGMRIYTAARLDRGRRGMGTTVTAAVLNSTRLLIGQVGDSRAHVIRDGRLVQVTKDQSLVQQLIDAKQLTDDEAKNFERSNIILQALGTAEDVHVDITQVDLRRGDLLVMCSDGLSGLVEPESILEIAVATDDLVEACRLLTDAACEGGGDDNITVLMARFDGEGLALPAADDKLEYDKYHLMVDTEDHTAKSILTEEDLYDDKVDLAPGASNASTSSDTDEVSAEPPSHKAAVEHATERVSKTGDESARPAAGSRAGGAPRRRYLVAGTFVLVFVVLALAIWLVIDRQPETDSLPGQAVPASALKPLVEPQPPVEVPPAEEQVPSLSLDNQAFKKVAPKPKAAPKAAKAIPVNVEPPAPAQEVPAQEDKEETAPEDKQLGADAEAVPEDSALEDAPNLILPILPEPLEQEEPDEPAAKSGGEKHRKKKPSKSPSEPLEHQKLDENPF